MTPWRQCRTRLRLVPPRGAVSWRVALEAAEADAWKPIQEFAFAERAELDRSLAALGLRPDEVEALYRSGEVELRT